MRTNAKVTNKQKNSFIYFQIGLIATMLLVLFVLEFKFETKPQKRIVCYDPVEIDPPFEFTGTIIVNKTQPQQISKPAPVKLPDVIEQIEVKKDEEIIEVNNEIETVDVAENNETNVESNSAPILPVKAPVKKGPSNAFSVEQLPMFVACKGLSKEEQKACFDQQLMKHVFKNLEYPEIDKDNGRQGRVFVEFIIDENGNVIDVKAIENGKASHTMKKAAEIAVKKLPKLIPAKQGNTSVSIRYTLPITFKLQ